VEGEQRAEVHVGEDVAVEDDHEAVGRSEGIAHAAGGAERIGLDRVPQADAVARPVAHRLADLVDEVGAGEDHVGDPVMREQVELVGEEGNVEQRDGRLGLGQRQRPEPGTLSSRKDDGGQLPGVQGTASLMSMTGMPSRIG
jgi:hypothetical protein